MKRQGVVPSNSTEAQPVKYTKHTYKPSGWAHDMVREIKRSTDKDGIVHLSGVAQDQLSSNLKAVPKDLQHLKNKLKGGFYHG